MLKYLSFFLLIGWGSASAKIAVKAVVKVPLVDLSEHSLGVYGKDVSSMYRLFPVAPDKGPFSCLRLHQLVFNQEVTIIRELSTGEVAIEVPGVFYCDGLHRMRNDFWMLKKDLIPVSALRKEVRASIPYPVSTDPRADEPAQKILSLKEPWYDQAKKIVFSVGTRFVRNPDRDTDSEYGILAFDPVTKRLRKLNVPKEKVQIAVYANHSLARQVFTSVLRGWAHLPTGFIPYVYGGSSFTVPLIDDSYDRVEGIQCGHKATYWERKGCTFVPKPGFDCSNMVLCAAQIAGLPYYSKNTLALLTHLSPLKRSEPLEEGDLVWYSGHVMIVSDVKKNLLIESIGYDSGYGRVHELHISKAFSGMKTFEDLKHAHFTKHLTYRLNSQGEHWRSVYRVKILKIV